LPVTSFYYTTLKLEAATQSFPYFQMNNQRPNGTVYAADHGTPSVGTLVVNGAKYFVTKNPILTSTYLLGIMVILTVGAGTQLSLDQRKQYDHIMATIDLNAEYDAADRYASAYNAYYHSKGWFSCDSYCQRNKARMEDSRRAADVVRAEGYARMSDAKKIAGLFSEIGVGEVKDSFWEKFNSGKRFAKRQSMWDAMFMGIRSISRGRDESIVEYGLKILIQVLVNFSLGLLMALVFFVFGLWTVIKSYQPSPLSAVTFFVLSTSAAFAFVTTYLLLLYGAAAGGVYGVAKLAENNMRLQAENGGQDRQRRQFQNRPHFE